MLVIGLSFSVHLELKVKMVLDNANPTLFEKKEDREVGEKDLDDYYCDEFDSREIFGNLSMCR